MSLDPYSPLSVRKIINASGTLTRLGGARMDAEVTAAMAEAARSFVDLEELLAKSGEYVARLLGVEAAYICAGAAAGLAISAAACLAGSDPARIACLPDTLTASEPRMPNKIAVHRSHRNGYDQGLRQSGAGLVEFGWIKETHPWQLEAALDEQTVAVAYFAEFAGPGSLALESVVEIAHRRRLPVIVDAAAELPPASNLHHFNDLGADLVLFSGGKDIGGPQSSGLILGRRDLIQSCARNASPNYSLGRSMKAGKEEIAGLVTALERYLQQDEAARFARWEARVAYWVAELNALPGVRAWRALPQGPGIRPVTIPRAWVEWDSGMSPAQVLEQLWSGEPPIAAGSLGSTLFLNPQTLEEGEEIVVVERLKEILVG